MDRTIHGTCDFARETGRYARKDKIRTYDSPEQIAACMSCEKPGCSGNLCARLLKARTGTPVRDGSRRPFGRIAQQYEYKGKKYAASELAEIAGITPNAMRARLRKGMDPEQAATWPARKRGDAGGR